MPSSSGAVGLSSAMSATLVSAWLVDVATLSEMTKLIKILFISSTLLSGFLWVRENRVQVGLLEVRQNIVRFASTRVRYLP